MMKHNGTKAQNVKRALGLLALFCIAPFLAWNAAAGIEDLDKLESEARELRATADSLAERTERVRESLNKFYPNAAPAPETAPSSPGSDKGRELYAHVVGPAMRAACLSCHNPQNIKAKLDLSTRDLMLKGGASGPVVVPGDAEASLLYRLVAHLEEPNMPYNKEKLPEDVILAIKDWINEGAPFTAEAEAEAEKKKSFVITDEDRNWWPFRPLAAPAVPSVTNESWPLTDSDRFVLARLEKAELAPNPEATKRDLIRRATFDLTGLPPTPDALDAFLNDASPDAYEKTIDALLASPRFGERWARHWLDIARFAESHGYEHDYDRPYAFHYRDFVIKALNMDLPYDTFVKWQLAGDEYEPENPLALAATGFLAAGTHSTQITKSQVEKERYDELDDMLGTTGTAMLGLTIGCARCHDHKFDPISARDYYQMLSTFTTTVRADVDVIMDPDAWREKNEKFLAEHKPLLASLAMYESDAVGNSIPAYLTVPELAPPAKSWARLDVITLESSAGAEFKKLDDGSYLATGANANNDVYTVFAMAPSGRIGAIRIEALADPSLPQGGPGRAANGNFALTNVKLTARPLLATGEEIAIALTQATATHQQDGLSAGAAIDPDPTSGWAIDPQIGKDQAIRLTPEKPFGFAGGTILTITMEFQHASPKHTIGRPRFSFSPDAAAPDVSGTASGETLAPLFDKLRASGLASLADDERELALYWLRLGDKQYSKLYSAVRDHTALEPKVETTKMLIASEGQKAVRLHTQGEDFLEETHFLLRGNPNQKDGVASQNFLSVLLPDSPDAVKRWQETPPANSQTSFRRRALANWLTDADAGAGRVLARVVVNRIWQHYMGRGIAATPSDFGKQGEPPSNPELLDHLAAKLIASGWKLKTIHKEILMSATYRQSADGDEAKIAKDERNALFWRNPRARLEAEAIRDSMLSVASALDETMFGPGTLDASMKRRSIYFTVKRSKLVPMMVLFDGPDALGGLPRRATTTVAPQSLLLMNNDQVREWSGKFADRLLAEAGGAGSQEPALVTRAYRIALSRDPNAAELEDAAAFLAAQRDAYTAANLENPSRESLTDFCQVVFGLNEFVYVD